MSDGVDRSIHHQNCGRFNQINQIWWISSTTAEEEGEAAGPSDSSVLHSSLEKQIKKNKVKLRRDVTMSLNVSETSRWQFVGKEMMNRQQQ